MLWEGFTCFLTEDVRHTPDSHHVRVTATGNANASAFTVLHTEFHECGFQALNITCSSGLLKAAVMAQLLLGLAGFSCLSCLRLSISQTVGTNRDVKPPERAGFPQKSPPEPPRPISACGCPDFSLHVGWL